MPITVLVAYATNAGSTREVADAVARTLRGEGLSAEVLPAKEVRAVDTYQAVILGAPLYMFRWHKDAHKFLGRHRKSLGHLPLAIFALGPWNNKEEELQSARDQLAKELAHYPWLRSLDTTVFVGKFDPAKLTFPYSWIPAMKNMLAKDERDWDAIQTWAADLAARLVEPAPAN
jgi:menaquinone-dependent protoporphyrinogen oxidase